MESTTTKGKGNYPSLSEFVDIKEILWFIFKHHLQISDHQWLWTLVVIVITTIATTEAQRRLDINELKNYGRDSVIKNNNDNKLIANSTQNSVLRPSHVLRDLWSSASKTDIDNYNDLNVNNSQTFAVKLREFLFRPTKWSSDIVPSIPLSLQLSSNAINLTSRAGLLFSHFILQFYSTFQQTIISLSI